MHDGSGGQCKSDWIWPGLASTTHLAVQHLKLILVHALSSMYIYISALQHLTSITSSTLHFDTEAKHY